jgi:hypothetical protein
VIFYIQHGKKLTNKTIKMTDKILEQLIAEIEELDMPYKPFIRQQDFENMFAELTETSNKRIEKYKKEYDFKMQSNEPGGFESLVKLSEEEFVKYFSRLFNGCDMPDKSKVEFYERLKLSKFKDWSIAKEFGVYQIWVRDIWVRSFWEYIANMGDEIFYYAANLQLGELFKENLFTEQSIKEFYLNSRFTAYRLDNLKSTYYETQGKYMLLVEKTAGCLAMESIKPFSKWVLNIGERSYRRSQYKLQNDFTLANKNKSYKYVNKNDCKEISDVFVNIFFINGNELLKISIGSEKMLQRTVYLISKDIQRVDIFDGNIVELHMHKHFDPEVILFEKDDDAYVFQSAISLQRASGQHYARRS